MDNKPHKNFRLNFIALAVFAAVSVGIGGLCLADSQKSIAPLLKVYKHGRVVKLNPQGKSYSEVRKACEKILDSGGRFVPVKSSRYNKWLASKKKRDAVELSYPLPRRFKLSGLESYATRFIIPLSAVATVRESRYGTYTEIFVFFDTSSKEEQVGPFCTQQNLGPLRKLVSNIK